MSQLRISIIIMKLIISSLFLPQCDRKFRSSNQTRWRFWFQIFLWINGNSSTVLFITDIVTILRMVMCIESDKSVWLKQIVIDLFLLFYLFKGWKGTKCQKVHLKTTVNITQTYLVLIQGENIAWLQFLLYYDMGIKLFQRKRSFSPLYCCIFE